MQANAVKQLCLIGRHCLSQLRHFCGFWIRSVHRSSHIRYGLQNGHSLQHCGHFLQSGCPRNAVVAQCIYGLYHRAAIALSQSSNQAKHVSAVHAAQHLAHRCFLQLPAPKRNGLVSQRQRISHGAARTAGQQLQRLGLCRNVFLHQNLCQVLKNRLRRHGPQIELQATRKHGHWYFLRIGRRQYKFQVLRRLFQRLQHGIESRVGQHVHLINHEDLEAPLHRLVHRLLQQALHLIHASVRGRIQLNVVRKASAINFSTGWAYTTRRSRNSTLAICPCAVQRFGQNTRHRGLSHTTRTGE